MNWCGKVLSVLNTKSDNNIINIEAGFGPTGLPHIGTLCEIIRTQIIKQKLTESGYKVNFFLVSDDLDPFRKIPKNVPNQEELIPYIGKPISSVPDPFGADESFSEMAEKKLMKLASDYEIDCQLIKSSDSYKSGHYNEPLMKFLANYKEINNICSLSTGHLRRRTYSIFMPFSPLTGKVLEHIIVTGIDLEKGELTYFIPSDEVVNKSGYDYAVPLSELYKDEVFDIPQTVSILNGACKLQWKADWAMRQMARNIHFEMHGEDLRASAVISKKIANTLNHNAPFFYPYGLFLDDSGKKISKSKGNGFSLSDAEILLSKKAIRIFLSSDPKRSRRFYPEMSPLLNDIADNTVNKRFSNQKLARIISAFHPVNHSSAKKFLKDKIKPKEKINEKKLERCLNLVFRNIYSIQAGVDNNEEITLKRVAESFKNIAAGEDKLTFILNDIRKLHPEMKAKNLYNLLYRGLFGRHSGPKLKTWLEIHDNIDIYNKLNSPLKSCDSSLVKDSIFNLNTSKPVQIQSMKKMSTNKLLKDIDFSELQDQCASLSFSLRKNSTAIVLALSDYQCSNVTLDEIERSCDLLDNIHLNKEYFKKTIRGVTSFLPLNQPLYASICFGFIPSLMAEDVCIRPPTAMHEHYKKLMSVVRLATLNPSLNVSYDEKEVFLSERVNVTDAIIFTGTPENAAKVRKHFRKDALFILNGAGHNPLVISEDASLDKAIESSLSVVLYNQGQDCAGPNAILVHKNIFKDYSARLLDLLKKMNDKIGDYKDDDVIVGPNSDPDHTIKISSLFKNLRDFCIYGGEINPINGLIKPTVFVKPLHQGGNYKEFFAPVFFLQPYESDDELHYYFHNSDYKNNAMYISLFGTSEFISNMLPEKLHKKESILYNTDLHLEERGFLPYGGSGPAASCVWINGERISGSTLPQRDIFDYLVKPCLTVQ